MKIFKNIFTLLLGALFLLPKIMDFSHTFSGHGHDLCVKYADEHLHESNLDCELYTSTQSPVLAADFVNFEPLLANQINKQFFNFYQFIDNFQKLAFELRGPPLTV